MEKKKAVKEKKRSFIINLIEQTVFTSIGLALKTKAEASEFAKDFVKKTELSESEGKKFIDGFLKRSDKAREKLEEKVESIVKDIVSRSSLATKDELEEIKSEIKKAIGLLVPFQIPILGYGLKGIGITADIIGTGCDQLRQGSGNAFRCTTVNQEAGYRQIR